MNQTPKHLLKDAFLFELENRKGLIPVSIDAGNQKIVWLDMGMYHFYEGFFHKSLNIYRTLKKNETVTFTTDLDILEHDLFTSDSIYPTGFIFHAGRCGSTLISKVLARLRENLVLSEAMPLNQILRVFTNNGKQPLEANENNRRIYHNLVLAMARKRILSHKYLFIKFTSFNIHFFSFIHSVFPDVPAIFLSRNPVDIFASFRKNPPAWLNAENSSILKMLAIDHKCDLRMVIDNFLNKAAEVPADVLKHVDYETLKPDNLLLILSYFNLHPTDGIQLDIMKSQFAFDSKMEFNTKKIK